MSQTPENAWADAGLVPAPDADVPEPDLTPVLVAPEHRPAAPRPDLRDEAAEPDVVEQALVVPEDEFEEYPEG